MTNDQVPRTPTRRSKRFQPLVTPSRASGNPSPKSRSALAWSGHPIHIRPTQPDFDLLDEEREDWKPADEGILETAFYASFERRKEVPKNKRGVGRKGKGKAEEASVERYKVGDTVLISTLARDPSIGVVVAMWETRPTETDETDQDKIRIRVHWFLRPKELASIRAKREHAENEIYYSLASSAVLHPSSIRSHCIVTDRPPRPTNSKRATRWSIPTAKSRAVRPNVDGDTHDPDTDGEASAERFYCHLAVDSRRGLFYEFDWPEHHRLALLPDSDPEAAHECGGGKSWQVLVEDTPITKSRGVASRTSPRKKIKLDDVFKDDESDGGGSDDEYREDALPAMAGHESDSIESAHGVDLHDEDGDAFNDPKTPSKKRKRAPATPKNPPSPSKRTRTNTSPKKPTTPRKPRTRTLAHPTPHSKAALLHRTAQNRTQKRQRPAVLTYEGGVHEPDLPEDPWLRAMHLLHVGSRPDALPCREEEFDRVLRSVGELLEEGSGGCVYISGVPGTGKTATVHAVVRELKRMAQDSETNPFTYVEINGLKIPEPAAAYSLLWEAVSGHDVENEGHLRVGAKESLKALMRHFSGARGPGGHACVVLMDELDQLVTAKQDVVYNFFNWPTLVGSKLVVLAVANTMDLPERVMTGRVRSRLGMIRINFQPYTTPQLEKIVQARLGGGLAEEGEGEGGKVQDVIAPDGIKFAAMKVSSISGDARRVLDICRRTVELVQLRRRTARTEDVKEVIKVMQNSPTAAYLRECSFHEKLLLAALVKCVKREGVEEIKWSEVQHQHLIYMNVLTGPSDPTRKPTPSELVLVLDALIASRAILMEEGLAASRKAEGERRVVLNLEQSEVERVLSEVGGQRWKSVLG